MYVPDQQCNMMQNVNHCGEWGRRIINQPEAGGNNPSTPAEAHPWGKTG